MADQALFAYQVQLPDGSTAVRTGGAERPPTHGELADYAANQGERYLGPVAMSPDIPREAEQPAAPPAPPPPAAPPPDAGTAAPPPAPGVGASLKRTFLPERSFTSELPSIVGGTVG